MNPQVHQGLYGEAFIQVLASATGLQVSKPNPDVTGEDFVLGYPGNLGGVRFPRIEVQIKSWSSPYGTGTHWLYGGLTEQQFSNLAGTFRTPRFLFLVLVPPKAGHYTRADHDSLSLFQAAYWASFAHLNPIEPASPTRKHRVEVPRTNLLTVKSLLWLLSSTEVEGR